MNRIEESLTQEERDRILSLPEISTYELLFFALTKIKTRKPSERFTLNEVAEFLYKDPKRVRGLHPAFAAIKARQPSFPDEMILKPRSKKEIRPEMLSSLFE